MYGMRYGLLSEWTEWDHLHFLYVVGFNTLKIAVSKHLCKKLWNPRLPFPDLTIEITLKSQLYESSLIPQLPVCETVQVVPACFCSHHYLLGIL